jgi:hypothetical protein
VNLDPAVALPLLESLSDNYKEQIMPWMLGDVLQADISTQERKAKKQRVFTEADLQDPEACMSFYNEVLSNVKAREKEYRDKQRE